MISNLPNQALDGLLIIFNIIWTKHTYPLIWNQSLIVPILKPNKPKEDPKSFRPIALINCMCKILEKIINKRLSWVLETNDLLSTYQNGGRPQRCTMDNILQLENAVLTGYALKQHTVAIFIDIEKAFDQTWPHKVLKTLNKWKINGHLFNFIKNFLHHNQIILKNRGIKSNPQETEIGIKQGSSLSGTLFNCILSEIEDILPFNVQHSIFMDDINIYMTHRDLNIIQDTLQRTLNNLENWTFRSGFKLSTDKTVFMHLHRFNNSHPINLNINGNPIKQVNQFKCLGLILDSKWTWKQHITNLKKKTIQAMNLMKILSHSSWGLKRDTLERIYKATIQPKLDYGSIAYDSAKPNLLCTLNPVLNAALRLISGAFRTSPVTSLLIEAGHLPLDYKRKILISNYVCSRARCNNHPIHHIMEQYNHTNNFDFGIKPKPIFKRAMEYKILSELSFKIITIEKPFPPWVKIDIHTETLDISKKDNVPNFIINSIFNSHLNLHHNYQIAYTDGSKTQISTGCAFILNGNTVSTKLNNICSNYTAELAAVLLLLKHIQSSNIEILSKNILIYTDSMSIISALKNQKIKNDLVRNIIDLLLLLKAKEYNIKITWIPSHKQIPGNEQADKEAKETRQLRQVKDIIECNDLKQHNKNKIKEKWNEIWRSVSDRSNKLKKIKLDTCKWQTSSQNTRKDEIIIARLRIGHTRLTHEHLLKKEPPPICSQCNQQAQLTIIHILQECPKLNNLRIKHKIQNNIRENLQDNKNH